MNNMTKNAQTYQLGITEELRCTSCGSTELSFRDFDKIIKRVDENKIAVTEIWACTMCDKEFGRISNLYSPQDTTQIKLRTAMLAWGGYSLGSMLGYMINFGVIV